jgi:hypothetical protein
MWRIEVGQLAKYQVLLTLKLGLRPRGNYTTKRSVEVTSNRPGYSILLLFEQWFLPILLLSFGHASLSAGIPLSS